MSLLDPRARHVIATVTTQGGALTRLNPPVTARLAKSWIFTILNQNHIIKVYMTRNTQGSHNTKLDIEFNKCTSYQYHKVLKKKSTTYTMSQQDRSPLYQISSL